jgi:fructokinase
VSERNGHGAIAVCGEALVDLVAQPARIAEPGGAGALFRAHPGGSPANVAVGLARLGVPTQLLARLSGDTFGRLLRDHLTDNGVGLEHAVAAAEPTTLAAVSTDADGVASYDFWHQGTADWQWHIEELPDPVPSHVVAVHTGSLSLALEPAASILTEWLRRVRRDRRVTVSIDPNIRPAFDTDPAAALRRVERQLRLADIVKVSAEDLELLAPGTSPAVVARCWRQLGPAVVVVTLGAEGCLAIGPDGTEIHRPAVPAELLDTVGAGDAFTAGLLAGLHRIGALGDATAPRPLAALGATELTALLDEAALVASLTCGRAGADPPTRDAVRKARQANGRPQMHPWPM